MTWWLLVVAGTGLWLCVAVCAVSLVVAAGRADARDARSPSGDILDELARDVESRMPVSR